MLHTIITTILGLKTAALVTGGHGKVNNILHTGEKDRKWRPIEVD